MKDNIRTFYCNSDRFSMIFEKGALFISPVHFQRGEVSLSLLFKGMHNAVDVLSQCSRCAVSMQTYYLFIKGLPVICQRAGPVSNKLPKGILLKIVAEDAIGV